MEDWKEIVGYEGLYKISSVGVITSILSKRERKYKIKDGYATITLSKCGKLKTHSVHRLLYEAFVGKIPDNLFIDHIDRNRLNNSLSNLRIVTQNINAKNKDGKGVKLDKRSGKWEARIRVDDEYIHLGTFEKEYDARLAYINAKEKYHNIILDK
jgi:hypothetical protein